LYAFTLALICSNKSSLSDKIAPYPDSGFLKAHHYYSWDGIAKAHPWHKNATFSSIIYLCPRTPRPFVDSRSLNYQIYVSRPRDVHFFCLFCRRTHFSVALKWINRISLGHDFSLSPLSEYSLLAIKKSILKGSYCIAFF